MDDKHRSKRGEPAAPEGPWILYQTPPDVKIAIGTDTLKMVSIGKQPSWTTYRTDREYWRHGSLSFDNELAISSVAFAPNETEAGITEWFRPMTSNAIDCPRINPSWLEGQRATPIGRTATLYAMSDPDDPEQPKIGVLFEVEGDVLKAVVVYRLQTESPGGEAWSKKNFDATLGKIQSSTDPNRIQEPVGDQKWWHTVMESSSP